MALLKEVIPFNYTFTEATQDQKKRCILGVVEGKFQAADTKNANGRIYPRALWASQLSKKDVKDRLENRAMVGELDHPHSGVTTMSKISHIVTENSLLPDGTVVGKAEILDTPMGRIVDTLFRAGVRVGISSRGEGSVTEKGGSSVVNENDYQLETYDFVLKPSTPGAYLHLSEEERSSNESLIVRALLNLVNKSKEPEILLEMSKILNSLDKSVESVALSEQIQTKLSSIFKDLTSNHVTEHPKPSLMEKKMEVKKDTDSIERLARDLAESKIAEVELKLQDTVSKKDAQISSLAEALQELNEKQNAAERLVSALIDKNKELGESSFEIGAQSVQLKLDAAESLLQESINRVSELDNLKKKYGAAEKLLVAVYEEKQRKELEDHINSLCLELPESQRLPVKNMLSEAASKHAADKIFEGVRSITTSVYVDQTQPLPNQRITESTGTLVQQPPRPVSSGSAFMSAFLKKC